MWQGVINCWQVAGVMCVVLIGEIIALHDESWRKSIFGDFIHSYRFHFSVLRFLFLDVYVLILTFYTYHEIETEILALISSRPNPVSVVL